MATTQLDLITQGKSNGVVMSRLGASPLAWRVSTPSGPLDTTGTTTQGLQEAITYAQRNGLVLMVYGGGITPPITGLPTPIDPVSRITCTTPIAFPTGYGNCYHFFGVDLYYNVAGGANPALDFITIDSSDFTEIDFHQSEVIYPGDAAAVRFLPTANNGEGLAGFSSSSFRFGVIAVVNPITFAPESTHGMGIRFSSPALGLGLPYGDGLIVNCAFSVGEINGGLVQMQVDNPGVGNIFASNVISSPSIHSGTTGVKIGTSAGAANKIYGNRWALNLTAFTTNLEHWGNGGGGGSDLFDLSIAGGTNGIILQSSSDGAQFRLGVNRTATPLTDNSTTHKYIYQLATTPSIGGSTAGASPYVFQNTTGRIMTLLVSGTITTVELSTDGSSYTDVTQALTNAFYMLVPAMFARITYPAAAPALIRYY